MKKSKSKRDLAACTSPTGSPLTNSAAGAWEGGVHILWTLPVLNQAYYNCKSLVFWPPAPSAADCVKPHTHAIIKRLGCWRPQVKGS
jgi:hypothetical protein